MGLSFASHSFSHQWLEWLLVPYARYSQNRSGSYMKQKDPACLSYLSDLTPHFLQTHSSGDHVPVPGPADTPDLTASYPLAFIHNYIHSTSSLRDLLHVLSHSLLLLLLGIYKYVTFLIHLIIWGGFGGQHLAIVRDHF